MEMNDAAEALAWHEERRKRLERLRAAWKKHQESGRQHGPRKSEPMGESWKPTMTPEQKAAQMQYIEANSLPF